MKLLLVSEGFHEHADPIWREPGDHGALELLVRRLIGRQVLVECRKPNDREFRRTRIQGKGHAYEKVVRAFLIEAERRGFDALIFLIDEDGDDSRAAAMEAAQVIDRASLPRACGVAIRSFDAWMIADEQALAIVLGVEVSTQPNPEDVKSPKEVCRKLRDASGCKLRLREVYARYAAEAELDTVKQRCPRGFAPFAARVEQLVRSL